MITRHEQERRRLERLRRKARRKRPEVEIGNPLRRVVLQGAHRWSFFHVRNTVIRKLLNDHEKLKYTFLTKMYISKILTDVLSSTGLAFNLTKEFLCVKVEEIRDFYPNDGVMPTVSVETTDWPFETCLKNLRNIQLFFHGDLALIFNNYVKVNDLVLVWGGLRPPPVAGFGDDTDASSAKNLVYLLGDKNNGEHNIVIFRMEDDQIVPRGTVFQPQPPLPGIVCLKHVNSTCHFIEVRPAPEEENLAQNNDEDIAINQREELELAVIANQHRNAEDNPDRAPVRPSEGGFIPESESQDAQVTSSSSSVPTQQSNVDQDEDHVNSTGLNNSVDIIPESDEEDELNIMSKNGFTRKRRPNQLSTSSSSAAQSDIENEEAKSTKVAATAEKSVDSNSQLEQQVDVDLASPNRNVEHGQDLELELENAHENGVAVVESAEDLGDQDQNENEHERTEMAALLESQILENTENSQRLSQSQCDLDLNMDMVDCNTNSPTLSMMISQEFPISKPPPEIDMDIDFDESSANEDEVVETEIREMQFCDIVDETMFHLRCRVLEQFQRKVDNGDVGYLVVEDGTLPNYIIDLPLDVTHTQSQSQSQWLDQTFVIKVSNYSKVKSHLKPGREHVLFNVSRQPTTRDTYTLHIDGLVSANMYAQEDDLEDEESRSVQASSPGKLSSDQVDVDAESLSADADVAGSCETSSLARQNSISSETGEQYDTALEEEEELRSRNGNKESPIRIKTELMLDSSITDLVEMVVETAALLGIKEEPLSDKDDEIDEEANRDTQDINVRINGIKGQCGLGLGPRRTRSGLPENMLSNPKHKGTTTGLPECFVRLERIEIEDRGYERDQNQVESEEEDEDDGSNPE